MRNMLPMNQRMTIWTNNHKVISFIIFSVAINMMYAKNIWNFIIATLFAVFYISPTFKCFSKIRKTSINFWSSLIFGSTFYRAECIILGRRSHKFFCTCFALKSSRSFPFLRSMIAQSRTIFGFITSCGNVTEFISTNFTIGNYLYTTKLIFAFSRAIFCRIISIYRYIKFFFTKQTIYKLSTMRFCHAAFQR